MRRAVLAVLVLAVLLGLWRWRSAGDEGPIPEWTTVAAGRGEVTATVTATGTVNPVETVQVGTYVSGPIQELLVDFNDPVTRGQLLARIDPRPFEVKVAAAEADLATAQARARKAEADARYRQDTLRRARTLGQSGIMSQSELDLAESEAAQAQAQRALEHAAVTQSAARLDEARVNLAYTQIRAPVDGVVVSRNVSRGQTVAASFQTPTLFLVATDLTRMEVAAAVSESDIGSVAEGQDVRFTVDAYPHDVFHGTVWQVRNAPVTVANVVTYDVLVRVANDDLRLKPGMTANVTIVTAHRDDVLRVPTGALRFRPPDGAATADAAPGPTVWQPDGPGRAAPRAVQTGVADERFTEITGGLTAGDDVITGIVRDPDEAMGQPQMPSFGAQPRYRGGSSGGRSR